MANITGVSENIAGIKTGYKKVLALGEGVLSHDFIMTIEGYPDLRYLVQSTQIAPLMRESVETYGPYGVQFNQQGRFKNAQDIPISFKEVIKGIAYEAVRKWVKNKEYLKVTFAMAGESYPESPYPLTTVLEDCWLELEGVDVSVEDGTLVKPSGTLHANWVGHLEDDDSTSLSME